MPVAEKTRHTRDTTKLISVSAKKASKILAAVKKIDPEAHIIEAHFIKEEVLADTFIIPEDTPWYREVKSSWHPGVTLRIRRENAKLTQAQLGSMTGLATANISAIENGRRAIGLAVAKRLAKALKRPISEFIIDIPPSQT